MLAKASFPLPRVLGPRLRDRLPLDVRDGVGSAAGERDDVVSPVTGTRAISQPGRRAGVLPLELPRHRPRPMLARRRSPARPGFLESLDLRRRAVGGPIKGSVLCQLEQLERSASVVNQLSAIYPNHVLR
jgi:hypothetical protein